MTKLEKHPTQQLILETAAQLFIQQGFSGTSISQIAKLAGINQSLIYHHFANKEDLWKAVKNYLLAQKSNWQMTDHTQLNLYDFLTTIITQRFTLYQKHPELLRLLHWQRLEGNLAELQGGNPASPDNWDSKWHDWQQQGVIKADIEPGLISALIASAITGALMDHAEKLAEPAQANRYIKLLADGIYAALRKIN